MYMRYNGFIPRSRFGSPVLARLYIPTVLILCDLKK